MPPSSHPRRSGTADVKGAGCPGGAPCAWVPIPKRAHLPRHLALPSQAQHHPAGQEAGSSAARAEGPMHPMLPSTTATNPGVHGSSVRGRPHYLLTEPSAASDGLSWPTSCMTEARLMGPSCPCALSSCWHEVWDHLSWVWPLHRITRLAGISDPPHPNPFGAGSPPLIL